MSNHPYSPAYFAQLQANYRAGKPGVWKRIALLREFLELSPTDTILETGFGQGLPEGRDRGVTAVALNSQRTDDGSPVGQPVLCLPRLIDLRQHEPVQRQGCRAVQCHALERGSLAI